MLTISAFALVLYSTLLNISREIEYIWSKPIRLASFFYLFTRYGGLFSQAFSATAQLILAKVNFESAITGTFTMTDDQLENSSIGLIVVQIFFNFCWYISIQGVLIIPAYSLIQGNKPFRAVLILGYSGGVLVTCIGIIPGFPPCDCLSLRLFPENLDPLFPNAYLFIAFVITVATDILVIGICLWNIWSIRKSRHETKLNIQNKNNIVSLVLNESVLRCFFMMMLTVIPLVISDRLFFDLREAGISSAIQAFQNPFSIILITDYILRLRQYNSPQVGSISISLQTIQIRKALGRIHRTLFRDSTLSSGSGQLGY